MDRHGTAARTGVALAALAGRFLLFSGLFWLGLWFIEVRSPRPWADTGPELAMWLMLDALAYLLVGGAVLRFLWTAWQGVGVILRRR